MEVFRYFGTLREIKEESVFLASIKKGESLSLFRCMSAEHRDLLQTILTDLFSLCSFVLLTQGALNLSHSGRKAQETFTINEADLDPNYYLNLCVRFFNLLPSGKEQESIRSRHIH